MAAGVAFGVFFFLLAGRRPDAKEEVVPFVQIECEAFVIENPLQPLFRNAEIFEVGEVQACDV